MSKSLARRTRQRMEYLRNLIEHPRTGEGERAAAEEMLSKLLKKMNSADLNPAGKTYVRTFAGFEGSRYQKHSHLNVKEIAALIRNEIKLIRKAGQATKKAGAPQPGELSVPDPISELPPEVKISVRVRHGASIDITVKGLTPEWFTVEWHDDFRRNLMTRGPRLEAAFIALREIHASYNYDNSDTQSDYFERNYWGGVEVDFYDRLAAEKFHQTL